MPLAFLFTGGTPWRLLGIAAGVALIFSCYLGITHIRHLEAQLDAESRIVNDNAVIAQNVRQAMDQANSIAAQAALDTKVSQKIISAKKGIIVDAPQTDDGPLAPVLRRTLDGLPGEDGNQIDTNKHASSSGKPDNM